LSAKSSSSCLLWWYFSPGTSVRHDLPLVADNAGDGKNTHEAAMLV
jgi:hypothetical protein